VKNNSTFEGLSADLFNEVAAQLDDDLNTPLAVASLFDALSAANSLADSGDEYSALVLATSVNALFGSMGLSLLAISEEVDEPSKALVLSRDKARSDKNWAEADRLRDELVRLGWVVEDSSSGTQIHK
jgi:cysteinyl-tRNA synthetase